MLPSSTWVPYPAGVKKAGIPAPPARIRSAKVPCGFNSRRISPDKYCRSNSALFPMYEAITWEIWCWRSKSPNPKLSTPQLLEITVKLFTFVSSRPAIRFSGMPHSPNPDVNKLQWLNIISFCFFTLLFSLPPTSNLEPEGISLTASSALLQNSTFRLLLVENELN